MGIYVDYLYMEVVTTPATTVTLEEEIDITTYYYKYSWYNVYIFDRHRCLC